MNARKVVRLVVITGALTLAVLLQVGCGKSIGEVRATGQVTPKALERSQVTATKEPDSRQGATEVATTMPTKAPTKRPTEPPKNTNTPRSTDTPRPTDTAAPAKALPPTDTPRPPTPKPTDIPKATDTPAPTATPTVARISQPVQTSGPQANRKASVRTGPGTNYALGGSLTQGQALDLVGRNQAGDWYKLASGAWIAAFLVSGLPTGLPIVAAPPPPPTATAPAVRASQPTGNCDPSYPTVCIPPPPPDLDCGEISFRRFDVVGSDPHRFDSNHDGIGCES